MLATQKGQNKLARFARNWETSSLVKECVVYRKRPKKMEANCTTLSVGQCAVVVIMCVCVYCMCVLYDVCVYCMVCVVYCYVCVLYYVCVWCVCDVCGPRMMCVCVTVSV